MGLVGLAVISSPSHFAPVTLAPYLRKRNIIFEACLFCFMAYRTRTITFEAR